jgi:hypothetical protein
VLRKLLSITGGRPTLEQASPPVGVPKEPPAKTWERSQEYELDHAYGFMSEPFFVDLFARFQRGEMQTSNGYLNELLVHEFFEDNPQLFRDFLSAIQGKACLDIGPCVFSPLLTWDGIGEAYAIEPLGDSVREWQRKRFGGSAFDNMNLKSIGADVFLEELASRIDGAIHCRNMLDHTPNWPFVLANISAYAAPGCHFLFWTDIDHGGTADEGHYDICPQSSSIKRLIEQLGFANSVSSRTRTDTSSTGDASRSSGRDHHAHPGTAGSISRRSTSRSSTSSRARRRSTRPISIARSPRAGSSCTRAGPMSGSPRLVRRCLRDLAGCCNRYVCFRG